MFSTIISEPKTHLLVFFHTFFTFPLCFFFISSVTQHKKPSYKTIHISLFGQLEVLNLQNQKSQFTLIIQIQFLIKTLKKQIKGHRNK